MMIQDTTEALVFRARPDPTSSDPQGRILARFVVYQEISDAEMKRWMTLTPKGSQGVAVNLFMMPIQPPLETVEGEAYTVDGVYREAWPGKGEDGAEVTVEVPVVTPALVPGEG